MSEINESPKGFVSAPTLEQLQPTKEEQAKLKLLWDWLEHSKQVAAEWKWA